MTSAMRAISRIDTAHVARRLQQGCLMCVELTYTGGADVTWPNAALCEHMAAALSDTLGSSLRFVCSATDWNLMRACAAGGGETNTMCHGIGPGDGIRVSTSACMSAHA